MPAEGATARAALTSEEMSLYAGGQAGARNEYDDGQRTNLTQSIAHCTAATARDRDCAGNRTMCDVRSRHCADE